MNFSKALLFSIAFFLITDLYSQEKKPYGGLMLNQDLAIMGFYEANISDNLLFVGRLGSNFGYAGFYGFQARPTARVSVRYLFGTSKNGIGRYNNGWYAELAAPLQYFIYSDKKYFRNRLLVLAGYRAMLDSKIFLEGAVGFGPRLSWGDGVISPGKISFHPVINAGVGLVLFSNK